MKSSVAAKEAVSVFFGNPPTMLLVLHSQHCATAIAQPAMMLFLYDF